MLTAKQEFITSDDDDDDNTAPSETESAPAPVKLEDSTASAQTPYELHVYSVEELQKFDKKGLLGDATLLEGAR